MISPTPTTAIDLTACILLRRHQQPVQLVTLSSQQVDSLAAAGFEESSRTAVELIGAKVVGSPAASASDDRSALARFLGLSRLHSVVSHSSGGGRESGGGGGGRNASGTPVAVAVQSGGIGRPGVPLKAQRAGSRAGSDAAFDCDTSEAAKTAAAEAAYGKDYFALCLATKVRCNEIAMHSLAGQHQQPCRRLHRY